MVEMSRMRTKSSGRCYGEVNTVTRVIRGRVSEREALVVLLVVCPLFHHFGSADGRSSGGDSELTLRPPAIKPEGRKSGDSLRH
mmetsp:Transcript_27153/g.62996  ORF Transcript_27153/g.62996 Transcript_27153/m.62996 type:complete len:84 (-) Transcript_27153:338-589(-)